MAYIKMEQYGQAILDADCAIKIDPQYVKAYYRRGSANFALGKNKAAKKDFKKVCQMNPKDKDARAKLAACTKAVNEADARIAVYKGTESFEGNYELTEVTFAQGVTTIGDYSFCGCSSLTDITIPDGVTSIGNHTFWGCSSLAAITIPDGVTWIGENAFRGCSSLTAITIPD
jgi:tetratricopeptide (TPR) repeat protein